MEAGSELAIYAHSPYSRRQGFQLLYVLAIALILSPIFFIPLSSLVYSLVFLVEDSRAMVIMIPCGSRISILFNNSVTGSPVDIVYRYCDGYITGISMHTDQAGYEYYSSGLIDVNRSLLSYRSGHIIFCSAQPALINIAERSIGLKNGCMVFISAAEILSIYSEKRLVFSVIRDRIFTLEHYLSKVFQGTLVTRYCFSYIFNGFLKLCISKCSESLLEGI
ncbi:MAG: hypothetical protein RQ885_07960 [Desulfurococcales archaeon]|jgi:hypothetical protein|nr:hypothetical protein [Desulfurococcales archaeon]